MTKLREIYVDPDCHELARKFLEAEEDEGFKHVLTDENVTKLGERIQLAVEDFFSELD